MESTRELKEQLLARVAEDEGLRSRLLADPYEVIKSEFGVKIPDGFTIEVYEDSATEAHLVLPHTE